MTVEPGKVAIVRFPSDQLPVPAVAMVQAVRGEQALVSKLRGPYGGRRRWSRPRWVPLADIARLATPREASVGTPIDPVPPREVAVSGEPGAPGRESGPAPGASVDPSWDTRGEAGGGALTKGTP